MRSPSTELDRRHCAACGRAIDAAAHVCPFCGANPDSGERPDTDALLREVFPMKETSTSDSIMDYARRRQGIVIAIGLFVGFLILGALHRFVTLRNASAVNEGPAIPLSEITDARQQQERAVPLPELNFIYEGEPRTMRTFIIERGATLPPEIAAANAAAAAEKAAAQQKANPAPPAAAPRTGAPFRPGMAPRPVTPAPGVPQTRRP